jgi:hypothetical protein
MILSFWSKLGWRKRSLIVFAVCLVAGHAAAATGLALGMPQPPYGDEARFYALLANETLRIVWLPWEELGADARSPAGWARAVLPVVGLWLAGEGVLHFVRNPLRVFRTVRRGGHDIFGGISPLGMRMLARWAGTGRAVLAVSPQRADCDAAVVNGGAALQDAWGSDRIFVRSGLARASSLALTSNGDLENIEAAVAASAFVTQKRAADTPPLHMLLQVNDPFLRARIDERIDRFGRLEAVQLRLVSVSQVSARRLLREFPPDRFLGAASPAPHAWIIGIGRMGEEIALSFLRLAHYRHGRKPKLTIIDRDAERCRASLLARWPGMERVGEVRFVAAEAENVDALCQMLLAREGAHATEPTAIYCCLATAESNAALALGLSAALRRKDWVVPPMFVRGRGAGAHAALGEGAWVYGYGDLDWVADSMLSVEATLDQLARHIHERYLAEAIGRGETLGARRALRPWLLLPEDLKDDNRNVADHHFVKIRDCGCGIVPVTREQPPFEFTGAEIEALAEVEHVRWLAARELNGWRYGETRDDANKAHPDMVPYAGLSEDRRDLDRDVVRVLPAVLREIGLAIVRDVPVAVTGPRAQWAFVPAFETAVATELAALKSSRRGQLVLWLSPDSALSCRTAELALEQVSARIALVLGEPPHSVFARLPDDATRERVRRLLLAAERIVSVAGSDREVGAELRAQGEFEVALSIDGEGLEKSPTTLGIDANGRVLCRPMENDHG